ncbi:MAG: hypothetical protein AVDCRST_MAG88-1966, partial [uncultured Thermomicrobiales bacterium]
EGRRRPPVPGIRRTGDRISGRYAPGVGTGAFRGAPRLVQELRALPGPDAADDPRDGRAGWRGGPAGGDGRFAAGLPRLEAGRL